MAEGEAVNDDVFKLVAVDVATNEPLGVVYCDLFYRRDKQLPTSVMQLQWYTWPY